MQRSSDREILDDPSVPREIAMRAHRDLARIHHVLGDTAFVTSAIRRDPRPVRRVLDVGCASGHVLDHVRRRLGVEAIGVDVAPIERHDAPFQIVRADAIHEKLPEADVAFSMYLGHHLSESELGALIRNVGRSSRRFILLDLVRHPLPLALFRMFVAPFLSPVAVADGRVSIRRSYRPAELKRIAAAALGGTGSRFLHSVGPCYIRQVVDISYAGW